ncbi:hypothetical protein [Flavobacterium subsaxonicum]|nr:hypothetical protein [Flavobacterium subsaxonicum]
MKYFLSIFALLLFITSCKKEAEEQTIAQPVTDTVTAPKPQIVPTGNTRTIIANFIERRDSIKVQVKTLSPEKANALYEAYKVENDSAVRKLEKYESNITENYYSYFTAEEGRPVSAPDSIQRKVNLLKSAGLEFWEIGEGYVEIRTVHDFYYSIFKNYVTPDYKDFLQQTAYEEDDLYSADAGIAIPFKAVGERVIFWENYIARYPNSKLTQEATENYKSYQYDYLFGQDNTPTVESTDNSIYPENLSEFNSFIKKYPNSFTSKLAQQVIDNNGKNYDALRVAIQKEQEKHLQQK